MNSIDYERRKAVYNMAIDKYGITAQTKTPKLKPCPFCGSQNLRIAHNYLERYSVLCLDCTILFFGRDDTDRSKKDELVEAWNRRANEPERCV